jgi:hypothetical protein
MLNFQAQGFRNTVRFSGTSRPDGLQEITAAIPEVDAKYIETYAARTGTNKTTALVRMIRTMKLLSDSVLVGANVFIKPPSRRRLEQGFNEHPELRAEPTVANLFKRGNRPVLIHDL